MRERFFTYNEGKPITCWYLNIHSLSNIKIEGLLKILDECKFGIYVIQETGEAKVDHPNYRVTYSRDFTACKGTEVLIRKDLDFITQSITSDSAVIYSKLNDFYFIALHTLSYNLAVHQEIVDAYINKRSVFIGDFNGMSKDLAIFPKFPPDPTFARGYVVNTLDGVFSNNLEVEVRKLIDPGGF